MNKVAASNTNATSDIIKIRVRQPSRAEFIEHKTLMHQVPMTIIESIISNNNYDD